MVKNGNFQKTYFVSLVTLGQPGVLDQDTGQLQSNIKHTVLVSHLVS